MIKVNSYQLKKDVDALTEVLLMVPRGGKRTVMQAIGEWLIGEYGVGLRYEPNYNYRSRAEAYGFPKGGEWTTMEPVAGYFSERQFRYVMAKIRSGEITPGRSQRTGNFNRSWVLRVENYDYNRMSLTNDTWYGGYLVSDTAQARQPRLVGWRTESQMIADNSDRILAKGLDELDKWLRLQFAKKYGAG